MTTKELIANIAEDTGIKRKQVEQMMNAMTAVISETLNNNGSVMLQKFGSLETKERQARVVMNPKTGEKSVASAKCVVTFRPNDTLKDIVKEHGIDK